MQKAKEIIRQVNNVVLGKSEIIEKVLMAMLAGGHVLLEDIPGVGKTTMALAFAKSMDMTYKRMQFTPDVMPSDVTGYTVYNKADGKTTYLPGAAMCNLFLADEINRTSSKTQSALLEVMEERSITVDGVTHPVPKPYLVIATQNPVGSAGTQLLPESQLDRFMVRLSMGYPDSSSEIEMLRRQTADPMALVEKVVTPTEILELQQQVDAVYVADSLYSYIAALVSWTRSQPEIRLGVSPRGSLALLRMAKACAFLRGRNYLVPQDVQHVFADVCSHRILVGARGRVSGSSEASLIAQALQQVSVPAMV